MCSSASSSSPSSSDSSSDASSDAVAHDGRATIDQVTSSSAASVHRGQKREREEDGPEPDLIVDVGDDDDLDCEPMSMFARI